MPSAREGTRPQRALSRKAFLAATAGSLAAVGAGLVAADRLLIPQRLDEVADGSRLYDYVVDGTKFDAVDWTLANMSDVGRLSLGSSEFYISKNLVAQCPQAVFGESNCGIDLTYIGEAYDQSLWQTIAAGAYASRTKRRQCMVFLSPQWFFRGGDRDNRFSTKFSYELFRAFCRNGDIPDELHGYVRKRAGALGVDPGLLAAADQDGPLDAINDLQLHEAQTVRLRTKLPQVIAGAPSKSTIRMSGTATGEPDWDALMEQADLDGAAACTNNELGVHDDYWAKNHIYKPELDQSFDQADSEYADFACTLDVLRVCGMDVLVVMQPMHGAWYDYVGVPSDVRDVWYDRVRRICHEHEATYADFHTCEYERYFFCDTVHPGWRGWVRIERAIYHYLNGRDDDFLGGWGFGDVTGEGLTTMQNAQVNQ